MPALFAAAAVILVLAQDSGGSMLRVIAWSLVLICLLMVGFFAISKLRHWMRDDDMPAPGIGFTLSDLRQLHKQGQMTDEEFERAKAFEDHVVLTESALEGQEVAIAFKPRAEWPKAFRFYRLYRS